jgi:GntR family transcriptional regulator/MocR family aminotransferase
MRRIYGERRQVLLDIVGQGPDWLSPFPNAAGLHLTLRTPPELDAARLAAVAAERGVGVYPASASASASAFGVDGARQDGLVLGYGVLDAHDVRSGALALLEAIDSVARCRG